ncbi:MAG: hypothetical protein JO227_00440 [Acetobacteraceae bacterium]|nr:hypothetical protein [Acetobacteraceae bacterium]
MRKSCNSNETCCLSDTGQAFCTDISTDSRNCNVCGARCHPWQVCCGGVCTPQGEGNCGTCGRVCPPGTMCCFGACLPARRIGGIDVCVDPFRGPPSILPPAHLKVESDSPAA